MRIGRRTFAGGVLAAGLGAKTAWAQAPARPNIVLVVVDDMRFDEYGAGGHAYLRTPAIDALGASGATFTAAYHVTPLCSPNRASIVTGQYASLHGIVDNTARSYASHRLLTFAQDLKRAGYETAHVGKWHMGNDPTPRPGYDYWVSFPGQGRSLNPELHEDGRLHIVDGYLTDLLTDRAVQFVTQPRARPFMLYLGHKAIHPDVQQRDDGSVGDVAGGQNFIPAPRHRGRYAGQVFRRRPNYGYGEEVRRNKPALAEAIDLRDVTMDAQDRLVSEETIQARAEMMLSVDESVGRLVSALEEKGLRENTLFVLMSDNGYFFGEHGLSIERRLPYEESIRSPLLISHPAAIGAGASIDRFALSIDIAPTLLAAAGVAIPARMQGRSLLPLLHGARTRWRDAFLVEYHTHENPFNWTANLSYRAVRVGRYKYVRWIRQESAEELYDLVADPFERRNIANEPTHRAALARARATMERLVLESLGLRSGRRG